MPFKFFKQDSDRTVLLSSPVAKVEDAQASKESVSTKDKETAKKKYKVLDRELRKKYKSLKRASDSLGISYYRLINVIRGLVKISDEEKKMICQALEIIEDRLFL